MRKFSEIAVITVMLSAMFLKLDPFKWFMPTEIQMVILGVLMVGVTFWVGMLYREKARDERETLHLNRASRAGYFAGISGLSLLVIVRDIQHRLDPMLIVVLALMIITKMIMRKIAEYRS